MRMRCFRLALSMSLSLSILVSGSMLILSSLAGCGPKTGDVKPGGPSLYDKLGGREAIGAVVADWVETSKSDERLKGKFAATTDPVVLDGLRTKFTDQICAAAGGPCTYTGKDMKTELGLSESDYGALVEDLKKTLDKFKVGEKEQTELVAVLAR